MGSAPVKAPLTYPKASLSKSDSGIAAQFIATKGFYFYCFRELLSATISLPVPLSPVINIG